MILKQLKTKQRGTSDGFLGMLLGTLGFKFIREYGNRNRCDNNKARSRSDKNL